MRKFKSASMNVLLFVSVLSCGDLANSRSFNGEQFLEWDARDQKLFFDTAVLMAGSIASLNKDGQAKCIYDWYFGGEGDERRQRLIATIRKYPEHVPTGVVIAVLQKACGLLLYR